MSPFHNIGYTKELNVFPLLKTYLWFSLLYHEF